MNINLCRSANTGMSMCRSPLENVAYDFVLILVSFVLLGWLSRWEVSGRRHIVLLGVASLICSKQCAASLCNPHLFFPKRFVEVHTVILTRLQLVWIIVMCCDMWMHDLNGWKNNPIPPHLIHSTVEWRNPQVKWEFWNRVCF